MASAMALVAAAGLPQHTIALTHVHTRTHTHTYTRARPTTKCTIRDRDCAHAGWLDGLLTGFLSFSSSPQELCTRERVKRKGHAPEPEPETGGSVSRERRPLFS
uniref:Putative secreted protein n=1 Tax=Anopheles marajoara TaxID=58244 RepID=A0A2M4C8F3_9DIPT